MTEEKNYAMVLRDLRSFSFEEVPLPVAREGHVVIR
jgi:hypothetical protein